MSKALKIKIIKGQKHPSTLALFLRNLFSIKTRYLEDEEGAIRMESDNVAVYTNLGKSAAFRQGLKSAHELMTSVNQGKES